MRLGEAKTEGTTIGGDYEEQQLAIQELQMDASIRGTSSCTCILVGLRLVRVLHL